MQFLCHYLGDLQQKPCGICDNDLKKINTVKPLERLIAKLKEFRETYFPVLEVENSLSRLVNGVAASYYGNSNVGAAIRYAKYDGGGDFPDWLLRITLKAYWKQFAKLKDKDAEESLVKENSQTDGIFDLILFVPPTETPGLVLRFAEKISLILQIPLSYKLKKKTDCLPQKNFESSISKKENVKDKFYYENPLELKDKKILLIDDIYDSGCTIKEIGRYLTKQGAALIAPLVIAKTVGGDL